MEQRRSWQASSRSDSQKDIRLVWKQNVPKNPIVSQLNLTNTLLGLFYFKALKPEARPNNI
jgi:hypothetical protein